MQHLYERLEFGEELLENTVKRNKMPQKAKATGLSPHNMNSRDKIDFSEDVDHNIDFKENDLLETEAMPKNYGNMPHVMINSHKMKQETFEYNNLDLDIVSLKTRNRIVFTEDTESLYENHIVKEELVIGPEIFQGGNSNTLVENDFPSKGDIVPEVKCEQNNSYNCYCCGRVILYDSVFELNSHKQTCLREFICDYCKNKFHTQSEIVKHIKTHLKHERRRIKKLHQAPKSVNSNVSNKKINLKRRKEKKDLQKDFVGTKCESCGKSFATQRGLKTHISIIHTVIKPPSENTEKCLKENSNTQKIRIPIKTNLKHKQSQNKKKLVQKIEDAHSEICAKQIYSKHSLKENTNLHEDINEMNSMCEICLKKFASPHGAKRHKKIVHDGIKPFNCEKCGKSYTGKYDFLYHMEKVHLSTATKKISKKIHCRYCNKVFDCKSNCNRHEKHHCKMNTNNVESDENSKLRTTFTCDICLSSYNQKDSLVYHMKKHLSTSMPCYICDICDKQYTRKYGLRCHMQNKHFNLKPYSCDNCKQQFRSNHYMSVHKKICLLKRKCNLCGRPFANVKKLTEHIKLHDGSKNVYQCDSCNWVYSDKFALASHIRINHMNLLRNFTCDRCQRTFTRQTALGRHIKYNCLLNKTCI